MGIYSNGSIFGITLYKVDVDGCIDVLFEKMCSEMMSNEEKKEAYLFYTELNNKHEVHFKYYIECSSTYSTGKFFMWYKMSLDIFLEKFKVN